MADNGTQPWATSWLPTTMSAIRAIAGDGDIDPANNRAMPNLSAIDTIALIGVVAPAVASAIDRFNLEYNGISNNRFAVVRSDGVLTDDGDLNGIDASDAKSGGAPSDDTRWMDAVSYLQSSPDPSYTGQQSARPWQRYSVWDAAAQANPPSLEPYAINPDDAKGSSAVLRFVRQMVADYQHMVDASASAIYANSANTTSRAPADDLSTFLHALGAVCGDLDTLRESPPVNADIAEALRYALAKSAQFTGKAAAEIAHEVGKTAGIAGSNLVGGFLEDASLVSILVVGMVGYLYLKGI